MAEETPGVEVAPPAPRRKAKPYALLTVFGVVIATLFGALATMLSGHGSSAGGPPHGVTVPGPVAPAAAAAGGVAPTSTGSSPTSSAPASAPPSSTTTTIVDPTGGTRVITIPLPPKPPAQPGHPGGPPPGSTTSIPGSSSSAPPSSASTPPSDPTDPTDPTDPSSTEPSDPPPGN